MKSGSATPILGIVFDMDGLLIDSEPIWQQSEIEVFGQRGLELNVLDCMQTMGLRIDEVVRYWQDKVPDFKPAVSDEQLVKEVLSEVKQRILSEGKPMPGAVELVNRLYGTLPLAVASSSYQEIIQAALTRLGILDRFEVLHSAEREKRGKPAPDVYLSACESLSLEPQNCLAFEDSPGGVRSALAAGMAVIAVPEPEHENHPDIQKAHLKLKSLEDFEWNADQLRSGIPELNR
ncbi:MAG: 2-deoxyglucose-6-phosphatase [Leptospiraceae bacterium]|nr:2-deoxyglucose-6-phosphatase [Leptospiraceae bacterium]